jgi:hypothetical protein
MSRGDNKRKAAAGPEIVIYAKLRQVVVHAAVIAWDSDCEWQGRAIA